MFLVYPPGAVCMRISYVLVRLYELVPLLPVPAGTPVLVLELRTTIASWTRAGTGPTGIVRYSSTLPRDIHYVGSVHGYMQLSVVTCSARRVG